MHKTVVTTKGQVVIPSEIRKKMNIKKGTKVCFELRGNELIIKPITPEYIGNLAGVLQNRVKLSKILLEERVKDRKREDR